MPDQQQSDPFAAFGGVAVAPTTPATPAPAPVGGSQKFGGHPDPQNDETSVLPATTPPATDPFAAFGGTAVGKPPAAPIAPIDADKSIGPEERAFLKANPTYQYLPKDSKFPNRQPGIYPMGPGNEWRNNPDHPMHDVSQFPVDLHLLKHSAQGAAVGAAVAGSAVALPAILEAGEAAAPYLADKVGYAKELAEYYGKEGVEALAKMKAAHPLAAKVIGHIVTGLALGAGLKGGGKLTSSLLGLLGE